MGLIFNGHGHLAMQQGNMSDPLCKYYETCGGCDLQHLLQAEYEAFKCEILSKIITRLGCDSNIMADLISVGAHSRRRAEFKTSVNKGAISLGFYAEKTHDVIDIGDCPVTQKDITAFIPHLRTLIASLKKPSNVKAINITSVNDGFDVYIVTNSPTAQADKQLLIDFCTTDPVGQKILRLAEKVDKGDMHILHSNGSVQVYFSEIAVELPLQPFLQATEAGQKAITSLVLEHTQGHEKVADLYCGCGAYSFPLAQQGHSIWAYEGNYDMVIATTNAIRNNGLEETIFAETRDLVKHPLRPNDLEKFDAVVINPPRNGASPQVKQIAQSNVAKVVMVSCSPVSFERDAHYLLDAGYAMTSITPIDQFYQTKHLELVAVFSR